MVGEAEFRPIGSPCWSAADRLADMDDDGIDRQVVSPTPLFFGYERSAGEAVKVARIFNDLTLECVAGGGDRMIPFCQVPLQDPDAACAELDRCLAAGHAGVEIGNHVGDRDLDDDGVVEFLQHCAARRRSGVRPPLGHAHRAAARPLDGSLAVRDARRDPPLGVGDDPRRRVRPGSGVAAGVLRPRRRKLPVLARPCSTTPGNGAASWCAAGRHDRPATTSTASSSTAWSSTPPRSACSSTRWGRTRWSSAATTRIRSVSVRRAQVVRKADFLTEEQRVKLLSANAVRFLGWT